MTRQLPRSIATVAGAILLILLLAPPASAHEGRRLGDLEMEVGFGTEPALVGEPNSVQLLLVHDDEPVVDLGNTLDVEVSFGEQDPIQLELEPFFEVGEFGTPGDYRAWFIPTSAGQYTFHFSGTIDGEDVDETFMSGPDTFSDVEGTADLQYPEQLPSTGELAQRIDREVPRLTDAIDETQTTAAAEARGASNDASSARTVGVIGIVVGALGLVLAVAAILLSRRKVTTA